MQCVDKFPRDTGTILEVVRLIHDHQVVDNVCDDAAVFGAAGRGQRGDHAREGSPRLRAEFAELFVIVGDKVGQTELARQLLPPLFDQSGRGDDEHAADHLAQQVLLEHQSSLNGLAPPHFVAQEAPTTETAQRSLGGFDLVFERGKVERVQADQLVKAGDERQSLSLQLQAIRQSASKASCGCDFQHALRARF